MEEIERLYTDIGGQFISPVSEVQSKLRNAKAFIFDWDGVFNNGQKNAKGSSDFNETDSMGTNLLRYSYFLKHGTMPITAIISGEKNESAFYFCERECFSYSFFKISNKKEALDFICKKEKIKPEQIVYFFDDVLDVPIAEVCGVRIQVNQKANPLFINYCIKNNLVDYLTANSGGQFAVRDTSTKPAKRHRCGSFHSPHPTPWPRPVGSGERSEPHRSRLRTLRRAPPSTAALRTPATTAPT